MKTEEHISNWLRCYATDNKMKGYVIGVSGGIDSAITSTLCALTGLEVITVLMPIHQAHDQHARGFNHINWLRNKYRNVEFRDVPLSRLYDEFVLSMPVETVNSPLALANSKARLRMTTLYAIAQSRNLLVAGTGNKVEDYGLGFFTKYGDGGVDVSPIGNLTKTEVWELGRQLGINKEIIEATPTDGLHPDNRSDEDQIGASYPEMEWAMEWNNVDNPTMIGDDGLTNRQKDVLKIYEKFHLKNAHKMAMPPICPRKE